MKQIIRYRISSMTSEFSNKKKLLKFRHACTNDADGITGFTKLSTIT